MSVNSVQSDDFSDDCSGENVNVEGHVAIDNGNSGEGDISTFSLLGCNSAKRVCYVHLSYIDIDMPRYFNILGRMKLESCFGR